MMLGAVSLFRPQSTRAVKVVLHAKRVVLVMLLWHVLNIPCDPQRYAEALCYPGEL